MALASTLVWEVRSGGSDNNGGGFNSAAAGIDRTLQTSPQVAINNTTITTSITANVITFTAGYTPTANDVGNVVQMITGTNVTLGFYEITAQTATTWTVTGAVNLPTSGTTTNATGNMGGALATPGKASGTKGGAAGVGHMVFVKNSSGATPDSFLCSSTSNVAGGRVNDNAGNTAAAPGRWVGYETTRTVNNTDANWPILKASSSTMTIMTLSGTNNHARNLAFARNASEASVIGLALSGTRCAASNVKATGLVTGYSVTSAGSLTNALALSCTTVGFSTGAGCTLTRCVASATTGANGFSLSGTGAPVTAIECVAAGTIGTGFNIVHALVTCIRCSSYNPNAAGTGFDFSNAAAAQGRLIDCVAYGNGGRNYSAGTALDTMLIRCAGGGGGTADNYAAVQAEGFITLTEDPFTDAAGDDFSLNDTAGGGALLKGQAFSYQGLSTTSYPDIGAAQSAGGGEVVLSLGELDMLQSTARNVMVFMTDSSDHITGKTGLTLTITASKNGAAFASITPTVTERGSGWYSLALTASHTDTLGDLSLHITATGADPTDLLRSVVAASAGGGGGADAATIADAVWDEARSGHATAGTFGEYANARLADGVAHGGTPGSSTATLALRAAHLDNPSGSALKLYSASSMGESAVDVYSDGWVGMALYGSTQGLQIGSATGPSLAIIGPDSGANPIVEIVTNGFDGHGIAITAAGTGKHDIALAGSGTIWDVPDNQNVTVTTTGGGGASAPEIADAVWDEGRSGHVTAGTFGEYVLSDALRVGGTVQTGGDLYPAIQGIGTATGAAVNTDSAADNAAGGIPGVTSGTTKVGTETGTRTNTSALNGVYHVITGTATALDWVYQFLTGGGTTPVGLVWTGYVNSANDIVTIYAWNHQGATWELIGSIQGSAGTVNLTKNLALFARHRGTSTAELGKVYLRFACTAMTSPVLSTDQVYVTYAVTSRTAGYANGAIWLDTVNGTAGTEPFVNGTADHPVASLADALALSAATGINRFYFAAGSAITLTAAFTGKTVEGSGYTLALGGQDISGSFFKWCSGVSGTGTSTGGRPAFQDSRIGTVTLPPCLLYNVAMEGVLTVGAAGDFLIINGNDATASTDYPVFDFNNTIGPTTLLAHDWHGGIEFRNILSGDFLVLDGMGRVVFAASCTGGERRIRGTFDVEDSSTGMVKAEDANMTLPAFFTKDTGQSYASAVPGSVVAEIANNTGVSPTEVADAVWTRVLAESYAADGAAFTPEQALFMMWSALSEFIISDTSITCKKLDGSSTAMVFTMDDADSPMARTRTS